MTLGVRYQWQRSDEQVEGGPFHVDVDFARAPAMVQTYLFQKVVELEQLTSMTIISRLFE